jgi:hypothetical protein
MALSKLDILKVKELKRELVNVPEWGGDVWVQEMTGVQRDRFDTWVVEKKETGGMRLRIVIATVVDEEGKPMFSDIDIPDLASKSGKAIERLSDVGMRLSGMTEEAKKEEIKNSEEDLNVGSSSASVVN